MESFAFWRDLEARFREPGDRACDLHATLDETNFQELVIEVRQQAATLQLDPTAHPSRVESMKQHLARTEAAAQVRTDPRGYWVISGGPKDKQERDVLKVNFESLAERAAVGADLAAELNAELAVQEWLHLVKNSESPYLKFFGIDQ